MLRKISFLILALAALLCYAQRMPKAAVYVMGNAAEDDREVFGNRIVDALTSSGKYAVMERSAEILAMLNREMDYQLSGEVDEGQISQIGHKLGVDYVFVVDLSNLGGDNHFASVRSVDIQSGKIMASVYGMKTIYSLSYLTEMARNLGNQLMTAQEPPRSGDEAAVYVSISNNADISFQPIVEAVMISGLAQRAKDENIALIERSKDFLHQLTLESNFQTSGEVSSDQIREWGKKFGVKYVYTVRIKKVRGEYDMNARRINVESSQDIQSWSASGPVDDVSDIIDLTKELVNSLNAGGYAGGAYGTRTFTVNGVSFNMVPVEGGSFNMGATFELDEYDNDERPVHLVTLGNYMIGETEVTQELWQAVMGLNPSDFKGSQRPVDSVSWNDCQEFINRLNRLTGQNFRLPTEAEWEYAARGGNKAQNQKFSGSNNVFDVAWFDGNSSGVTHDVKTKMPNPLGLYDMSGNVLEWCSDWYGDYTSSSQTNPTGPSYGSDRVLRGGAWRTTYFICRVSQRGYFPYDLRYNFNGLRLALNQAESQDSQSNMSDNVKSDNVKVEVIHYIDKEFLRTIRR